MLESIQSLRRHYPDQVRGYVLSRLFQQHPFVINYVESYDFGGKNTAFFEMSSKKSETYKIT